MEITTGMARVAAELLRPTKRVPSAWLRRVLAGVLVLGLSTPLHAKVDPVAKCRAAKLLAAGKEALAKVKCEKKGLLTGAGPDPDCLATAEEKFAKAISKAEKKVACPGAPEDLETSVGDFVVDLVAEVPPCAPGGTSVGGACWYLGLSGCGLDVLGNPIGCSCDDVCTAAGLSYDPATETYAGSGGTLANCTSVMRAFFPVKADPVDQVCAVGLGCYTQNALPSARCTSPPTTPGDSLASDRRACACR